MKNKLKVFRAMHDLTQEDLAEKVGVTRQTINAREKKIQPFVRAGVYTREII